MSKDPCDRCPGDPKVLWEHPDMPGLPILLCQHHSNEHGPGLTSTRWIPRTLIDPASDHRPGGALNTAPA